MPDHESELVQRGQREASEEDWLTRARGFRLAVLALARQVPGNPDYPFLASPRGPRNGTLATWNWFVGDDFDEAVLPALLDAMEVDSPLLDLSAASALQATELLGQPDRWLDRTQPLILRAGKGGRLRIGVFNWTTDRDAFIGALMGAPVPSSPRYVRAGPHTDVELEGDLWSVQEWAGFKPGEAAELFGASPEQAVANITALAPVVGRIAASEPGASDVARVLMRADPAAWADSPLGRLLLPLSRAAPGWRSPRVSTEWAAAFDLGLVGVHGLALWAPGAPELRRHRRAMAAHLRYLFDHHVSPWNRWTDDYRRREGLLIFWRRLTPLLEDGKMPTIGQLASIVRRRWPATYEAEPAEVTLRRLYRSSGAMSSRPVHRGAR